MTACKPGWCIHTHNYGCNSSWSTVCGLVCVTIHFIILACAAKMKFKQTYLTTNAWLVFTCFRNMTISTQQINYALDNKSMCRTIEIDVQFVFLSTGRGHWSTVHSTLNFKFICTWSWSHMHFQFDFLSNFDIIKCSMYCRSIEHTYRLWFHQYIECMRIVRFSFYLTCVWNRSIYLCLWVSERVCMCMFAIDD